MSYIDKVKSVKVSLKEVDSDLICFGVYKDKSMTPLGNEIDENLQQAIDSAIDVGDIKGKKGEVNFFYVNDYRYALNSTKIINSGWNCKMNFKDSIKNTITWYLKNKSFLN